MTETRPPAARCGALSKTGRPCRSWVDEGERCAGHGGRGRTPAPSPWLPGEPLCAGCPARARVLADGKPLCTRHAAMAARKAAAAAKEAAYWEEMFAPEPGQPYKTDPEWQAAKRDMLTDVPGENDGKALRRRIDAIYRVHEIESRYEASGTGPGARTFDPGKVLPPGQGIVWKAGAR